MRLQINRKVLLRALCIAGGLLIFSGCGKKSTEVSGTVKLNGKAIKVGEITFIAEDGSLDTSQIKDGAYTLYRAPVGMVKITVKSTKPVPYVNRHGGMKAPPEGAAAPQAADEQTDKNYIPVPKKYNDAETTDLTYEVKSGKQEYNIDLTP
jgi:hypothetical protein